MIVLAPKQDTDNFFFFDIQVGKCVYLLILDTY
jgi:hypothetical protein